MSVRRPRGNGVPEGVSGFGAPRVSRGVQPSCPLFSGKVAEYFDDCLTDGFEMFMLFYDVQFPFCKVNRGFAEDFGLVEEIVAVGEY